MLHGARPAVRCEAWRTGDQRYYVSDTRRFQEAAGWRATVPAADGIERLYDWLLAERGAEFGLAAATSVARTPVLGRAGAA